MIKYNFPAIEDPGNWDEFNTKLQEIIEGNLNEIIRNKFPDIGIISDIKTKFLIDHIIIQNKEIQEIQNKDNIKNIIEDIFNKINSINEKEKNLAPNGSGVQTDYSQLIGFQQLLYILDGKHNLLDIPESPPTKKPVAPSNSDVKFIFTRHAFSCNNLSGATNTDKAVSYAQGMMDTDPSVLLYGILQAHFKRIYDKSDKSDKSDKYLGVNGQNSRKDYYTLNPGERVYVPGLIRSWQSAVLLYLPNLDKTNIFELEVVPFIKEKHSFGEERDVGNFPSKMIVALSKFKKFLEYLTVLSKDIRELYIGRTIKLYYLDLVATFEIKKGGVKQDGDSKQNEQFKANYGQIPDVKYNDFLSFPKNPTKFDDIDSGSNGTVELDKTSSLLYRPYVKVCLYNNADGKTYNGEESTFKHNNKDEKKLFDELLRSKFSETLKREDIIRIRDYEVHTLNVFKKDYNIRNGHNLKYAYLAHENSPSRGGTGQKGNRTKSNETGSFMAETVGQQNKLKPKKEESPAVVSPPRHKFIYEIKDYHTFNEEIYTDYTSKEFIDKKKLLYLYEKNKNLSTFIKFYEKNPEIFSQQKTVRCVTHSRTMQEFVSSFFKKLHIPKKFDPDEARIYSFHGKKKRQQMALEYIETNYSEHIQPYKEMLKLEYEIANHNVWDLVVTYNTDEQVITSIEIRAGIDKPYVKETPRKIGKIMTKKSYGLVPECEQLCDYYSYYSLRTPYKRTKNNETCRAGIINKQFYSHVGDKPYKRLYDNNSTPKQGGTMIKYRKTRKLNKRTRKRQHNKKNSNKRKTRHRKK